MGWFSDIWHHGFTAKQRARSRATDQYCRDLEAFERELMRMSIADAQARSANVLASSVNVQAVLWESPVPDLSELASGVREFFGRIRRVEAVAGGDYVDAAELAPLASNTSFLCIGSESGWHVDVALRPGDERVYVISNDVPPEEGIDIIWPSIHHWILNLQRAEELL